MHLSDVATELEAPSSTCSVLRWCFSFLYLRPLRKLFLLILFVSPCLPPLPPRAAALWLKRYPGRCTCLSWVVGCLTAHVWIRNFHRPDGGGGNGVTTTKSVQTTNLADVSSNVCLVLDVKPPFMTNSCEFCQDSYNMFVLMLVSQINGATALLVLSTQG